MLGQAAGDLVEQQHARPGRERARELQPLALEQGERAGAACWPWPAGRCAPGSRRSSHSSRPRAVRGAEGGGDQQVLEHRHPREGMRDLIGAADAGDGSARAPAAAVMSAPSKRTRPLSARSPPVMRLNMRALAGAVRADDAERLAGLELQREIAGGRHRAEALRDVLQPQQCGHGPHPPRCARHPLRQRERGSRAASWVRAHGRRSSITRSAPSCRRPGCWARSRCW